MDEGDDVQNMLAEWPEAPFMRHFVGLIEANGNILLAGWQPLRSLFAFRQRRYGAKASIADLGLKEKKRG